MERNPWMGALAGAAGGLLGSWMMVRVQHLMGGDESSDEDRQRSHEHRRRDALPNDTDGTIPDEPATMQAAEAIGEPIVGRPLSEKEKETAAPVVHYAFGAAVGAIYGAMTEYEPNARTGMGVPFGATVWLLADEVGVPLAGFSANPTAYPVSRHVSALVSHLVYGLSVESVRRVVRGAAPAPRAA